MEKMQFCSIPDVARILGITPKRVHQLVGTTGFPDVYQELGTGPIWGRDAILAYKTQQDAKYDRVNKLLSPTDQVTKHGQGSDMKAIMKMHKAAKEKSIGLSDFKAVLMTNGWLDYYRSLVRSALV